jgi:rhodanese-related sulfurtransferase
MNEFFSRLPEFAANHWLLVSAFVVVLILLLANEIYRGGQGVNASQATLMINRQNALVLDIRPSADYRQGYITESINIPATKLADSLGQLKGSKERPVILIYATGQNVSAAIKVLTTAGFTQVCKLTGGIAEWRNANLPLLKK